jgi:hypothetical protein
MVLTVPYEISDAGGLACPGVERVVQDKSKGAEPTAGWGNTVGSVPCTPYRPVIFTAGIVDGVVESSPLVPFSTLPLPQPDADISRHERSGIPVENTRFPFPISHLHIRSTFHLGIRSGPLLVETSPQGTSYNIDPKL